MSSLYAWRRRTRRGDIRACGAHSRTPNTDTKLLIYGLFQEGRVLAQDGVVGPLRVNELESTGSSTAKTVSMLAKPKTSSSSSGRLSRRLSSEA